MKVKVEQNTKATEVKVAKRAGEKVITEYVCEFCGKKFTAEKKYRRKFCSEACRKAYLTKYNSAYVKARRENDAEFAQKTRDWAKKTSDKGYATKIWNGYLEHADAVLELAKMEDARILIAKYLDQNLISRARGYKQRTYQAEDELKAIDTLESLGDKFASK